MGLTLPENEIVIAHGKASFLKQEKIAKILREGGGEILNNPLQVPLWAHRLLLC